MLPDNNQSLPLTKKIWVTVLVVIPLRSSIILLNLSKSQDIKFLNKLPCKRFQKKIKVNNRALILKATSITPCFNTRASNLTSNLSMKMNINITQIPKLKMKSFPLALIFNLSPNLMKTKKASSNLFSAIQIIQKIPKLK